MVHPFAVAQCVHLGVFAGAALILRHLSRGTPRDIEQEYKPVDFLCRRRDVDRERFGALGVPPGPTRLANHGGRPTGLRRWINYPINGFRMLGGISLPPDGDLL
ncbi:MAG: hypothetical protein JXB85_11700 [Anaerolineales bacterium]|nr:hypothetical protein [Anaerolineales bacterium]